MNTFVRFGSCTLVLLGGLLLTGCEQNQQVEQVHHIPLAEPYWN